MHVDSARVVNLRMAKRMIRGVGTGVYRYINPKSVYLKFLMWLFCLLAMIS